MAFTPLTETEIKEIIINNLLSLEPLYTSLASFAEYSRIRNEVFALTVMVIDLQSQNIQTADNGFISTSDEDGLEGWLADKGMTWGEATFATVTVNIGSAAVPAANIEIPQLFNIGTKDSVPIIFQTTVEAEITPSTPADTKGYYTVAVTCSAVEAGVAGNVAAETITKIMTSISGIDVCWNGAASSGGTDREDIEAVRARLLAQEQIFDRWTESWIQAGALAFSFVKTVFVVRSLYGNGSVSIQLGGTGYITDPQLLEVQNWFDDPDRDDVGAVVPFVSRSEQVSISITVTVYRIGTAVTTTTVTASIDAYFNGLLINEDFIINKLEAEINKDTGVYDNTVSVPAANVVIDDGKVAIGGTYTINLIDVTTS